MVLGRAQYALFAIPCVLNLLGMFYVMMGAAFRPGSQGMLFTGGVLFLFVASVFGFSAGARARDLGWPAATSGIGMTILIGTGPMVLLPVAILVFMPGKGSARGVGVVHFMTALIAFLLPWGVVWIGTLLGRP